MSETRVIKARGLPFSATAEEVLEFFSECSVVGGVDGIHFGQNRDGRPSGEAYVEVESEDDVQKALERHKCNMGKRYIEVFESKHSDLEYACNKAAGSGFGGTDDPYGDDAVVKLRGLPYDAGKMQIADFFKGLEIEHNGILLVTDFQGRPSGEAYVQFTNVGDGKKALLKNKENIGHRYIEVFNSSMDEANRSQQQMSFGPMRGGPGPMRGGPMGGMRPGPYDRRGGMGGYGGPMGGPPMGGMGGGRGGRNFSDDFGGFGGFGGGPMGGMGMGGGGGGGRGMGASVFTVHMRGLPFRVTEHDICEWFSSVADPVDVFIHFNDDGRPSGKADVSFATDSDARRAMQKDKQNMQHRYIELFYQNN